jgi:hypothetical protein
MKNNVGRASHGVRLADVKLSDFVNQRKENVHLPSHQLPVPRCPHPLLFFDMGGGGKIPYVLSAHLPELAMLTAHKCFQQVPQGGLVSCRRLVRSASKLED